MSGHTNPGDQQTGTDDAQNPPRTTHFGYQQVPVEEKVARVRSTIQSMVNRGLKERRGIFR